MTQDHTGHGGNIRDVPRGPPEPGRGHPGPGRGDRAPPPLRVRHHRQEEHEGNGLVSDMKPHSSLSQVSKQCIPLFIGLTVLAIGISFGYNCGYAVNPARDLAPRLFTRNISCHLVISPSVMLQ